MAREALIFHQVLKGIARALVNGKVFSGVNFGHTILFVGFKLRVVRMYVYLYIKEKLVGYTPRYIM